MNNKYLCTFSLLLISSFANQANASFSAYLPLEQNYGGALPSGSVVFTNTEAVEVPPTEPMPRTPAEICNENAVKAQDLIASKYPDYKYLSHTYGEYMVGFPPTPVNGCSITVSAPASNNYNCLGNEDYVTQLTGEIINIGFDVTHIQYYGTCK